jgi:hypothetical protein
LKKKNIFTENFVAPAGNRELISGSPGMLDIAGSHNKIISSPFFPSYYPRDYGVEHVLTCKIEACRVHVLFTDFQISTASTMEVYSTHNLILVLEYFSFKFYFISSFTIGMAKE